MNSVDLSEYQQAGLKLTVHYPVGSLIEFSKIFFGTKQQDVILPESLVPSMKSLSVDLL